MQRPKPIARWPRRDFPAPRSAWRLILGTLVALVGGVIVGGGLLAGVAAVFLRFPEYAALPNWTTRHSLVEVMRLILKEPLGWLIAALALVVGALIFTSVALPTDGIVLLPDKVVMHQGVAEKSARYWEIDRIWLKRDPSGKRWVVLEGAFLAPLLLPLHEEDRLSRSTSQALPHILQRIPTWTRVSPDVKRLVEERTR